MPRLLAVSLAVLVGISAPTNAAPPAKFKVKFETTAGDFVLEVETKLAPLGAARFHDLVKDKFYDGAAFFRVPKPRVPGGQRFVAQFGIAADPKVHAQWDKKIKDDPVVGSNTEGTICFATSGPNTRTTQLFLNLKNNAFLDRLGFAPFGKVVEGMKNVHKITDKHDERPNQTLIERSGNKYLKQNFPGLDYIKKATVVPAKKP